MHDDKRELNSLFDRQRQFQIELEGRLGHLLKHDIDSRQDFQEITKETVLQMFSEINEILNEINWKSHKESFAIDENKIKEEIIDVFVFTIKLALTWGMTPNEFYDLTINKINKNFKRFVK